MWTPLLDRHGPCFVGFGHLDPLTTHLGIELHLDGAFVQIVLRCQRQHHAQAIYDARDHEPAVKVQLSLSPDKLDGEESSVVYDFNSVEVDASKDVAKFVFSACVASHVAEFKVILVHFELEDAFVFALKVLILFFIGCILLLLSSDCLSCLVRVLASVLVACRDKGCRLLARLRAFPNSIFLVLSILLLLALSFSFSIEDWMRHKCRG